MDYPIPYMRTAMLFARADDKSKQQNIMALETFEAICRFFEILSSINSTL
jgi:hypothetical protein